MSDGEMKVGCLIVFVFFAALFAFAITMASWECSGRWGDSNLEYRFKIVGGCQVKVDNAWLPEDRYREMAD